MKKTLLTLALGALLASCAWAQAPEKRNEVFVGVGDPGIIWVFYSVSTDIIDNLFLGNSVTYGDQQGGFQVFAGYQRRLGRWAGLGLTGSWAGSSRTTFVNGRDRGKDEIQLLTLVADARAHWLRKPRVDLYSGIAFGITHLSSDFLAVPTGGKDESTVPAIQLLPFGIRIGGNTGGFFETGIGTNGFVKAGLSQRL